jgi:hypothetical protein
MGRIDELTGNHHRRRFFSGMIARKIFPLLHFSIKAYVTGTICMFLAALFIIWVEIRIFGLYVYTYLDMISSLFIGLSVGAFIYFPCYWAKGTKQFQKIWVTCLIAGWCGIGWFLGIIWADLAAKNSDGASN